MQSGEISPNLVTLKRMEKKKKKIETENVVKAGGGANVGTYLGREILKELINTINGSRSYI